MRAKLKGLWLGLMIGFVGILLVGMMVTRNLALEGTITHLKLFNDVLSLIRGSYVDEVKTDSLMKGAYEGMLAELDPFSEYLTAQEYAEYVSSSERATSQASHLAGVGMRVARKEGIVLVVSVIAGSEAELKGITPGDHIRRISDESTREMSLSQIQSALSGPAGTSVAVSVARREEPHKIDADLTRRDTPPGPVTLDAVDQKEGIAVLRVPHFEAGAMAEVAAALERAERQHVRRTLIDLRGNAWGGMDEAARTAGLLMGDTVVARLKGREGVVGEVRSGRGRASYTGQVALLVNGATAEAAELFAAAVHEGRGAPLLGEPTFGVGAQQEVIPLKNGAYIKLSVRKYVSPAGTAWHGGGLKPEIPVAVAQENLKPAERLNQQLKQAIQKLRTFNPTSPAAATTSATLSPAVPEEGGDL